MQKVLVGMEGLVAVCGDVTGKTLAGTCTYTAVISACGVSWMALKAMLLFDALSLQGPQPVTIAYTTVILHNSYQCIRKESEDIQGFAAL